jgi:hypothetical protein
MTRRSKPNADPVEIGFDEIVLETDKAWLVKVDKDENVWLPKSQCELDEDAKTVMVAEWLAIDKGLV